MKTLFRTKSAFNLSLSLILLSFAAFLIYLPSELGAALTIPPDSSEYSICLANLFQHGRFGFTLNGEWFPSRYAPFFSLLCLSPAYFLSGGDVLCLHWAILMFALVLLVATWKMGRLCGLGKLSILPPTFLMLMPDFLFYSRVVMTEIPYTALFAILALVFVRYARQSQISIKECVCIGLLIAWTGLIRSTGFTLVIPFAVMALVKQSEWGKKAMELGAFSFPIAIVLVASFAYNWAVFGSPFRNGYNFWQALPCDYPNLMFNFNHVIPVVSGYLMLPIVQCTLVFVLVSLMATLFVVRQKIFDKFKPFLLLEGYVLTHALVLLLLHAAYYAIDSRFLLPLTICAVPLFFAAINVLLSVHATRYKVFLMLFLFVGGALSVLSSSCLYLHLVTPRSIWLAEARVSAATLPTESVVIQIGDPNVMEYFGFRDRSFEWYPLKRDLVYVKNMVSPHCITHVCPSPDYGVYRPPWARPPAILPICIESGLSQLPFPSTFEDCPEMVKSYLDNGKRVFFVEDCLRQVKDCAAFRLKIEQMGLTVRRYEVGHVLGISHNPIRHLYDTIVFSGSTMDERQENVVAYYEIVHSSDS